MRTRRPRERGTGDSAAAAGANKTRLISPARVAAVAAAAAACSSFESTGGVTDGGVVPIADAAADASADDASLPEASVTTSPCATAHTFCDDFERTDNVLGGRWQDFDRDQTGNTSIELAPGQGYADTNGLVIRVTSAPGKPTARARLRFSLPDSSVKRARLSFRIRVVERQLGDAGFLSVASLYYGSFPSGNPGSNLEISKTSGRAGFAGLLAPTDDAGIATQRFSASAIDDKWHAVELETDFDKNTVVATVDGTQAPSIPPVYTLDYRYMHLTIFAGLYWDIATIDQFIAYYDDIVLDVE